MLNLSEFRLFILMGLLPLSWWLNKPTQSVKALLANANGQVVEALRIGKTRLKTTHVVGRVFVGVNATSTHNLYILHHCQRTGKWVPKTYCEKNKSHRRAPLYKGVGRPTLTPSCLELLSS